MTYPDTPCCGEAPTVVRQGVDDPEPGSLETYRCEQCGEEHEACGTELSSGGECQRLATECSFHD